MPQAPIATLDSSQTRSMAISGTYIEIPPIYKVHAKAIWGDILPKIWLYHIQYLHFRILEFPLTRSKRMKFWGVNSKMMRKAFCGSWVGVPRYAKPTTSGCLAVSGWSLRPWGGYAWAARGGDEANGQWPTWALLLWGVPPSHPSSSQQQAADSFCQKNRINPRQMAEAEWLVTCCETQQGGWGGLVGNPDWKAEFGPTQWCGGCQSILCGLCNPLLWLYNYAHFCPAIPNLSNLISIQ